MEMIDDDDKNDYGNDLTEKIIIATNDYSGENGER